MTITSNTVANQALQLIGDNIAPVTGQAPTFDNSTAGVALQTLYEPCVRTVLKQHGFDFTRNVFTLAASGNAAPFPWSQEYIYPPAAIEIWQLQPASITDANNPLPQNWAVGNNLVAGTQTKVIWTDLASAEAVMNNAPAESTWDAGVQEAVVRLLASELSMAIFGRPDSAQDYLQSSEGFEQVAEERAG